MRVSQPVPVPELSRFYGIVISIYYEDHGVPHFHAEYSGYKASIRIDNFKVQEGRLTRRAMALVVEWARQHSAELKRAWERAGRGERPGKIAPLP